MTFSIPINPIPSLLEQLKITRQANQEAIAVLQEKVKGKTPHSFNPYFQAKIKEIHTIYQKALQNTLVILKIKDAFESEFLELLSPYVPTSILEILPIWLSLQPYLKTWKRLKKHFKVSSLQVNQLHFRIALLKNYQSPSSLSSPFYFPGFLLKRSNSSQEEKKDIS